MYYPAARAQDQLITHRSPERWSRADEEPDILSMMADPIMHLLLQRDGLSVAEVLSIVADVRRRIFKP